MRRVNYFRLFLALHGRGAAGVGGGDGLAVVRGGHVAAGEDALQVRRRAVVGQRVEQAGGHLDALPGQGRPGQVISLGCHRQRHLLFKTERALAWSTEMRLMPETSA